MLERITPLILCRNEEPNIGRTLAQLAWAREVVVVDSFSDDATPEIACTFPNVRITQRPFDTMAQQWNYGIEQVRTEWVLTLDADYFVPEAFAREVASLAPPDDVAGYEARFVYAIDGRPLRATLYTPRVVLLRMGRFTIYQDGHTQRVRVDDRTLPLREPLLHDDRKNWRRFVERQRIYMRQEASKLQSAKWGELNAAARLRKLRVVAPLVIVPYTLFAQRLILDGTAGLRYAAERFVAEVILARELWRR